MSNEAKKIINYINRGAANEAQAGGGNVVLFPASYNIPYGDAVTLIDVYHDIVNNKGFDLPTDTEKARAITKEMRAVLGISDTGNKKLWPMSIVTELKKINTTIGPDLYEWIFPSRIKKEEEKPGGIIDILSNIKWIALSGLAALVLLQTGILKKAIK